MGLAYAVLKAATWISGALSQCLGRRLWRAGDAPRLALVLGGCLRGRLP